jgi:hypothetical protein
MPPAPPSHRDHLHGHPYFGTGPTVMEKTKKDMFHVLGLSKVGEHPELAESPS